MNKGIAKTSTRSTQLCFFFDTDVIYTRNNDIVTRVPFDTGINGFIIASQLLKVLKGLKGDTLSMNVSSNSVELASQQQTVKLALVEDIEEANTIKAIDAFMDEVYYFELPDNFYEHVKMCQVSASADVYSASLTCINFNGEYAMSTNNSYCTVCDTTFTKCMLPSSAMSVVLESNPIEYAFDDNKVLFRNTDGMCCQVTKKSGEYPDIVSVTKKDKYTSTIGITFNDDIISDLSVFDVFVDKASSDINLIYVEGETSCKVYKQTQEGEASCYIDCQADDAFDIMVSLALFKDLLRFSTKMELCDNTAFIASEDGITRALALMV